MHSGVRELSCALIFCTACHKILVIFLFRLQRSIPGLDERIQEEQLNTTDRVVSICVVVSFMD